MMRCLFLVYERRIFNTVIDPCTRQAFPGFLGSTLSIDGQLGSVSLFLGLGRYLKYQIPPSTRFKGVIVEYRNI